LAVETGECNEESDPGVVFPDVEGFQLWRLGKKMEAKT
jgi:hypothetical protein